MLRIGVLASTKGTDMQAIINAIKSKKLNAVISVVISDKKEAYALERAANNNIKSVFIGAKGKEREIYDKEVAKELEQSKADLVLLIGWMRILSPWFVRNYKNKIINIHPSLLPAFAGGMDEDVHKRVLERGCKVSGCTLHFVDENVDQGSIIMQKAVEITQGETAGSLKEKVQKAEQEILLKALDSMTDKLKVKQKNITWWKDIKFLSGMSLIILSIIIGEFGKGLFIIKFYKLKYLLTGLFMWAFSWILLLLGVFLVGWETVKMIRTRIHHHVKKTVKDTYNYTKKLRIK